ncbi:serine hydrolase [Agromyces seonyuensis]|uniref:Serine hydrolase n=1 Tax=Agromyces seonyuensis TaxID=2662446 RepID=A0A6I4P709_9MICO|nr:serine hydrolase [Agromyces seonyuensis]
MRGESSGRRARHAPGRKRGKRAGSEEGENFDRGFKALGDLVLAGVQVSARATDLATGRVLFSIDDHVIMPTASIGKVLLLVEVAARLQSGGTEAFVSIGRSAPDAVGDAGIWQHLQSASLPMSDLAALVGSASDNLATNVLLRSVGLEAVRARTEQLGLTRTALLDLVRDQRGPDDAPQLSIGSTKELTWLFASLARGEVVSPEVSQRVIGWLSLNSDLSMVASAFGLDPLAHRHPDHGILLVNKTGTDGGVRAEAGVLRGPRAGIAYAVSTYFADTDLSTRLGVLAGMREVGTDLLEYVH